MSSDCFKWGLIDDKLLQILGAPLLAPERHSACDLGARFPWFKKYKNNISLLHLYLVIIKLWHWISFKIGTNHVYFFECQIVLCERVQFLRVSVNSGNAMLGSPAGVILPAKRKAQTPSSFPLSSIPNPHNPWLTQPFCVFYPVGDFTPFLNPCLPFLLPPSHFPLPLGALPSLAPGQQDNTPAAAAPTMAATESFHTFNLSFKISPWVLPSKVFLPNWPSWLCASLLQKFFGRLTRPVCISMSWHSEYKYKSQRLHMQWLQLWKNVMKPQPGRKWASSKLALNIESSTLRPK